MSKFFSSAVLLSVAVISSIASGQDPRLAALLESSPSRANSISYIHGPSLMKLVADSGMAVDISEEVSEVWLVSEIDSVSMTPRWEAGYVRLTTDVQPASLAKAVGGYVDTVSGKDVVWSPKQLYLLPLEDSSLGFLRPANRSLLSTWLAGTKSNDVSSYLLEQSKQPREYLSLLVAFDLKDAFSPVTLKQRISTFSSVKAGDVNAVTDVLASVQGASIIIGRHGLDECILSFEFARSPTLLKPFANALLDEVLNQNGTGAHEVLTWKTKVDGNTLSFQGRCGEQTLDGLLGVFTLHEQAEQLSAAAPLQLETDRTGGSRTLYASQAYFKRTTKLVERVRKYNAHNTGYRAKWNDQYARRIDGQNTQSVDPELVAYGSNVATLLRQNALAMRGVNIQAGIANAENSGGGGYGGNYYRNGSNYYSDPNSSASYQRAVNVQAQGSGNASFLSTMAQIDQLTSNIRRAMAEKHDAQF